MTHENAETCRLTLPITPPPPVITDLPLSINCACCHSCSASKTGISRLHLTLWSASNRILDNHYLKRTLRAFWCGLAQTCKRHPYCPAGTRTCSQEVPGKEKRGRADRTVTDAKTGVALESLKAVSVALRSPHCIYVGVYLKQNYL